MKRIIRRVLNKIRRMDGRRPMLIVAWVLAALMLGVAFLGGGQTFSASGFQDGREELRSARDQSETAEEESAGDVGRKFLGVESEPAEPETIPIGQIWYVKLEEYGSDLPYYDKDGNELGRLNQGDAIEVLPWEGDRALFYYNEEYDTTYVEVRFLSEEEPGRLTRPVVEPLLTPEEAGRISIHIHKERRDLELLSNETVIATYSIGLGGWPWDTKIAKGDSRTPEGSYYICVRNENSRFHLALGLSYPNKEDAERGYKNGVITKRQKNAIDRAIDAGEKPPWNTGLGGEIMIHGSSETGIGAEWDWTAGCIAVDDEVMDILWQYCRLGTEVVIDP